MIPYVAMIHGIDTYKLLAEVNKQAVKAGRIINCLLQIHVAQEETKFGFSPDECKDMLNTGEWKELTHVRICGLMGMASNKNNLVRRFGRFPGIIHGYVTRLSRSYCCRKYLSTGRKQDFRRTKLLN